MDTSSTQRPQPHILVIDQNRDALALFKTVLISRGYRVSTAEDCFEGLKKIRRGNFHLILTELSLSRMSGWELARIVKKTSPEIRVALVTGWDFGTKPDHSPFDAIISKPFQLDYFRGIVESLIQWGTGENQSDATEMVTAPEGLGVLQLGAQGGFSIRRSQPGFASTTGDAV